MEEFDSESDNVESYDRLHREHHARKVLMGDLPPTRFPFVREYAHITPQSTIEATPFRGWETAKAIHSWLGGRRVFYVPRGFTHPLRYPDEWAVRGAITFEEAPEFLVVRTPLENMRCNLGAYIIRDINGDGGLGVVSGKAFHSNYVPVG